VIQHKNGDPTSAEVLSVVENVAIPEPNEGEFLVKVACAAINPVDYKIVLGDFPGRSNRFGFDVSGTIAKIGPGCTAIDDDDDDDGSPPLIAKIGLGCTAIDDDDDGSPPLTVGDKIYADAVETGGSFAEYVLVQQVAACRMPKNSTFKEAAALPLAGLTALQGLTTQGRKLQLRGQKVAILGGSGGVGSLAVQLAKALGAAHVYATGSAVELIRQLGADTVINYREVASVEEELKGLELDLVFDTVGGSDNWKAAQASLKSGGTFECLWGDHRTLWTNTKAPDVIADMKQLTDFIESGAVKALVDERDFQLTTESVGEIVKASMSHRTKGKLVLSVTQE